MLVKTAIMLKPQEAIKPEQNKTLEKNCRMMAQH